MTLGRDSLGGHRLEAGTVAKALKVKAPRVKSIWAFTIYYCDDLSKSKQSLLYFLLEIIYPDTIIDSVAMKILSYSGLTWLGAPKQNEKAQISPIVKQFFYCASCTCNLILQLYYEHSNLTLGPI